MSTGWKTLGLPHKGWSLETVIDIREDGRSVEETEYESCMMCNNERIRYVHIVTHPDIEIEYRVGCICAGKMIEDYAKPRELQNKLEKKANSRKSWIKKEWHTLITGNQIYTFEGHRLLIFKDAKTKRYKCQIGKVWGNKTFDNVEQAKSAIFTGIEFLKQKGKW